MKGGVIFMTPENITAIRKIVDDSNGTVRLGSIFHDNGIKRDLMNMKQGSYKIQFDDHNQWIVFDTFTKVRVSSKDSRTKEYVERMTRLRAYLPYEFVQAIETITIDNEIIKNGDINVDTIIERMSID